MNKRVLYVSYLFPPVGGVGVLRTTKFVKFLPHFGWDVTVLTAENPSVPLRDESLLGEIPESSVVRRARSYEPSYAAKAAIAESTRPGKGPLAWLQRHSKRLVRTLANGVLQPDAAVLWYPQAVREGMRILSDVSHDAIVVSAPPFSGLLVGARLARKTGIPLVLDYRDEWGISTDYWENKRHGRLGRWIQQKQQNGVLRRAAAIVATTPGSAAAIGKIAAAAGSRAVATHIYNGFDTADFPKSERTPMRTDYGAGTDRLRIVFAGTLWTLTSIQPFVKAVEMLSERHPRLLEHLEVVIAGRQVGEEIAHLNTLEALPCHSVNVGFLDHGEALELMRTADWLLQLQSDLPGAERVIASKLFEYLGAARPILAITGEGDHCDVARSLSSATVCSPHDIEGIAEALAGRLEAHRCGVTVESVPLDCSQYHRRQLTAELADLLDRLVEGRGAPKDAANPIAQRQTEAIG
jgi:glycosyltransferase involved in cell wall biosynthesis